MIARSVPERSGAADADLIGSFRRGCIRHHVPDRRKIAGHGRVNLRQNIVANLGRQRVNQLARDAQILWLAGCQSAVNRLAAGRVLSLGICQHVLQTGEKTQIDGIGHRAHTSVQVAVADIGATP